MSAAKRTPCPVSRDDFDANAPRLVMTLRLHGSSDVLKDLRLHGSSDVLKELELEPQEFSTGSLGWYGNDKVDVPVNGCKPKVQIGLNLTLCNSKELAPRAKKEPAKK